MEVSLQCYTGIAKNILNNITTSEKIQLLVLSKIWKNLHGVCEYM
jgi:hypothetical protein